MFFNRKPPSKADVDTMRVRMQNLAPPPPVVPPVRQALWPDFVDTTTLRIDSEIRDMKDLPVGAYLPFEQNGIPARFEESFAVLKAKSEIGFLLVANDSFSSHPQFDLQRRLRAAGLSKYSIQRASREIIKAVHAAEAISKGTQGDDTDAEKAAWALIDPAIELGASDIHIESRGSYAEVFYRIHGTRIDQPNISMGTAMGTGNVLYTVYGDEDSKKTDWDPKTVQTTTIEHRSPSGKLVQLRFSSRPIHPSGNVKIVMRILVMNAQVAKPLEEIGYTNAQVAEFEDMLVGAQGIVLMVGPTNSGKSTTLQAMVQRIYERRGPTIAVDTLEDPVEYIMARACQTGVPQGRKGVEDKATGSAFTTFLKGFLQQDPDVIVIGEIHGRESASAAAELVLTGRKMLSTLHLYEAFAVFPRLAELGVPLSLLLMPGFISGVIYQRLVRVLCAECAIPIGEARAQGTIRATTYERVLRVADLSRHKVMTKGHGCEHCKFTGIVGRTPCAEVLVPDRTILSHLVAGDEMAARRHWMTFNHLNVDGLGVTAVAHAISKMRQGLLDPADIEAQIGPLVADLAPGFIAHGAGARYESPAELPPALRQ